MSHWFVKSVIKSFNFTDQVLSIPLRREDMNQDIVVLSAEENLKKGLKCPSGKK